MIDGNLVVVSGTSIRNAGSGGNASFAGLTSNFRHIKQAFNTSLIELLAFKTKNSALR